MRMNIKLFCTAMLLAGTVFSWAQEKNITGQVTDSNGFPISDAYVYVEGTENGVYTDANGNYSLNVDEGDQVSIEFIGFEAKTISVTDAVNYNVTLTEGGAITLTKTVATALGQELTEDEVTFAQQEIDQEQLNITQDNNVKSALAGKIAGVQVNSQAGSKLGYNGKIRIRGAISLTSDADALYIVNGIPTDPNNIDMNNVESVNVLKGPNATALYGQRASNGVVVIETRKGSKNKVGVELFNSTTFDVVSILPKMQNKYGGGYEGEDSFGIFGTQLDMSAYPDMWQQFEGERYLLWDNNYADESWGPAFDGEDFVPWYAWWPDSPYYGQTAKYEAHPDNIKDFYNTGINTKTGITIYGGGDEFKAMLGYTYNDIEGITPSTGLTKNSLTANFTYQPSDKFDVNTLISYSNRSIQGEFDDTYSNQTTGSFNSWFSRGVDINKLKELKDLETPDGYNANWNWWGPDYYSYYGGEFKKPAFWFNPYTYMERFDRPSKRDNLLGKIDANYHLTDNITVNALISRDQSNNNVEYYMPYSLSKSAAPGLYNDWANSFGIFNSDSFENNFSSMIKYENTFDLVEVSGFVGGNIRRNEYKSAETWMDSGTAAGGLIIPDLYQFSNARDIPVTDRYNEKKQVNSLYGALNLGYNEILFLNGTYRQDWSSALPEDNNGYGYPSVGMSFLFHKLIEERGFLTYGKLRAGWAQVGSDLGAHSLYPTYPTGNKPFNGSPMMWSPNTAVDPNLVPALNTAIEAGLDLRFLRDRIALSATYYDETREDEIVSVEIPTGSGKSRYLTNGGETQRKGIELTLTGDIAKNRDGFNWKSIVNFSKNKTEIIALPEGLEEGMIMPGGYPTATDAFGNITLTQQIGEDWGQIRGNGLTYTDDGQLVLQDDGLFVITPNKNLGSVLPDFTGGWVNQLSYKDVSLTFSLDFQKGGNFYSLSEMWGQYSGLLDETAGTNDLGNPVRDAVADGGGVHVEGVNQNGDAVDTYVEAYDYFHQGRSNDLAELYIHDASYIKLRDVSLSYTLPGDKVGEFFQSATFSVVARNLWLIAVSDDNDNRWDPSEMSQRWGEDSQLPGIRSYGFNVKLTF